MRRFVVLLFMFLLAFSGFAEELSSLADSAVRLSGGFMSTQAEFESARAAFSSARADFFPALGFAANYAWQSEVASVSVDIPMAGSMSFDIGNSEQYVLTAAVSWNLFSGLERLYSLSVADKRIKSSSYLVEAKRLEVIGRVVELVLRFYSAEASIAALDSSYSRIESNLAQVRSFFEQGVATELDVNRLEIQLSMLEKNRLALVSARQAVLDELAVLSGKEGLVSVELPDGFLELVSPEDAPFDSYNLENNPSVVAAAIMAESGDDAVGLARSSFFPRIDVSGSYVLQNPALSPGEDGWDGYFRAGVSVNLPLFSGGKRLASLSSANASSDKTDAQFKEVLSSIRVAAARLMDSLKQLYGQYAVQKDIVGLKERQYELVKELYEQGQTVQSELISAEQELTEANLELEKLKYSYLIAYNKLLVIYGRNPLEEK